MSEEFRIPLIITEKNGIERVREPVSIGIPFPKGKIFDTSLLYVSDKDNTPIPFAVKTLNAWSDESIKWALFDIQISLQPHNDTMFFVKSSRSENYEIPLNVFDIEENKAEFIINTGKAEFCVDRANFRPFKQAIINGTDFISEAKSKTILVDSNNALWMPRVEKSFVESSNCLKTILYFKGPFSQAGKDHSLRFKARLYFYAGHSYARLDFTLWNPEAAVHPGGLWDLGDPGSIFFKDLSIHTALKSSNGLSAISYQLNDELQAENQQRATSNQQPVTSNLLIYQDSSGGENWNSRNHVNHNGQTPLMFRGYRIYQNGQTINEGLRATPIMAVTNGQNAIVGTLKHFWQNFPSAIEADGDCLRISPFPNQFNDQFELQGGEQKTHTIYLNFCNKQLCLKTLAWIHQPLAVQIPPDWYCSTGVFPYVIPKKDIPNQFPYKECYELTKAVLTGEKTFFDRREIIDEYGWRNFGDQYADHENLLYKGEKPIISHYNNQYDLINSFLMQYVRAGENDWFMLAEELANHVMDIDIYRTDKDRYEYNRGLFWHTDHYTSAATSTHRGFSRQTLVEKKLKNYGGGPSYEHVYSNGLLNYYFLTGDMNARSAVIELATYVVKGIDGPDNTALLLKQVAKNTVNWLKNFLKPDNITPYDLFGGPGRASGNALSVLLDAFILTKDTMYISRAEYLIRQCIHPKDDLSRRNLSDVNKRWMYTIFLQSVGKYLDIKTELQQLDYMYFYARESLLHYARWMLENEVPFLSRPELLDFPNFATRAATDTRKANVLILASKYSKGSLRTKFLSKAKYFFDKSIKDMLTFEARTWTRPLAILMQNMNIPLYFAKHTNEQAEDALCPHDFGSPGNQHGVSLKIENNNKE